MKKAKTVVTLTPVNRQLSDYPKLLRAVADDVILQECPYAVRLLSARDLYDYADDLEALALAYGAREH